MSNITNIGAGVTICGYSDRQAATVIAVSSNGKTVTVQDDTQTLDKNASNLTFTAGGFMGHVSGTQVYTYERNTNGMVRKFSLRKNGRWVKAGENPAYGTAIVSGRNGHYDYNF